MNSNKICDKPGLTKPYKYRYINAKFPVFCTYCEYSSGEHKPLNRRGHIISSFVYKTIRDALKARNRAINNFQTYDAKQRHTISQDGLKFKHLCDDCEKKFGNFETHFRGFLDKAFHENYSEYLDEKSHSFFLSIAWRIIYSASIRSEPESNYFLLIFSDWLIDIPKQIENPEMLGKYDTYFFSGKSIVQEILLDCADDKHEITKIENEYLFSVRQVFNKPEIFRQINGIAIPLLGSAVLYVQLGIYHFIFTPTGYFDGSIVNVEKIGINFYSIPCIRDMKALGDIYGQIRPDSWCRTAYLERHN